MRELSFEIGNDLLFKGKLAPEEFSVSQVERLDTAVRLDGFIYYALSGDFQVELQNSEPAVWAAEAKVPATMAILNNWDLGQARAPGAKRIGADGVLRLSPERISMTVSVAPAQWGEFKKRIIASGPYLEVSGFLEFQDDKVADISELVFKEMAN